MRRLAGVALWCLVAAGAWAGEPVVGAAAASSQQAGTTQTRETTVVGDRLRDEETTVGPYRQPKWTDRRRFPGVRLYVAPPGAASAEFWLETRVPAGDDARVRTVYELSFGLGHRLQLDLYLRTESSGLAPMYLESERVELRWAIADWGVLPGNPTIYLEWIRPTAGASKGELKLLLGGALASQLFWGLNLFFERELWGPRQAQEYGLTAGFAWSLLDSRLSVGAETRIELTDTRWSRPSLTGVEVLVGPTVSWRPVSSAHLLLVWYVGPTLERVTTGVPLTARFVTQPTLVLGWRF